MNRVAVRDIRKGEVVTDADFAEIPVPVKAPPERYSYRNPHHWLRRDGSGADEVYSCLRCLRTVEGAHGYPRDRDVPCSRLSHRN